MKKNFIYLAVILLAGCQDQYDICDKSRAVNLDAGFYRVSGGIESIAYADTFSFSVLNASSGIYEQALHISKFSFPLNPSVDSAQYLIRLSNSWLADTLTLKYSSQNVNISKECGNVDIHVLSGAWSTKHSIDSVKLVDPNVNTTVAENLKIYF